MELFEIKTSILTPDTNSNKNHITKKKKMKKTTKTTKTTKTPLKKGPWLLTEDLLLKKWVEENCPKNRWACARIIPGRNSRQCNQHWHNSLKPNLKIGNWTSEEIFLIMVFYKKFNGSWKRMIPIFKSKTGNSIKNIFYSKIRKISKFYGKKEDKKENLGLDYLLKY